MRDSLPTSARYIEALPEGLDSYPEIETKASLVRSTLEGRPLPRARLQDLPATLRKLAESPPPVSAWIPEVHSHALLLAVYDASCKSLEDFERYCYLRQRRLFDGPLYQVVLKMVSPKFLRRTARYRWGALHRGTKFEIERVDASGATVLIRHPPNLWNRPLRVALAAGIRASLDLSGAQGTSINIDDGSPEHTRLVGAWRSQE